MPMFGRDTSYRTIVERTNERKKIMGYAWILFWGAYMKNGFQMSDKLWKLVITLGIVDVVSDFLKDVTKIIVATKK